jgi:hypothetical protein
MLGLLTPKYFLFFPDVTGAFGGENAEALHQNADPLQ